ncbi:DNA topoisomerase (ATP-hydrolyzing) subunit B [Porphyromonas miyakawae]|uniref:DNA gyrase subunit B n=2 Tax=Porphyromonas miyakawae TaxID=3137470 RepID=A0ABQ0E016_9PORP
MGGIPLIEYSEEERKMIQNSRPGGESTYSADKIQVLEGLEAVRKRPAMYIGDISERGLHHLVNEVVDNSVDEALAGYCTDIDVRILPGNAIRVTDNGRGIPVDMHPKEHRSALEVVMTTLHAGGKFDQSNYKVSGGLHGVGVSCVNALSKKLVAEVKRDGKLYRQTYHEGKPEAAVQEVGTADGSGTIITFYPDDTIFTATEYKFDLLARHLRELAFLNAGLRLRLTDEREQLENGNYRSEEFFSEQGLVEFVAYLDRNREPLLPTPIHVECSKEGFPPIDIAITYNKDYQENVYSYVNDINTIEGGTHVTGFRRALTRTLKAYADQSGMLSKAKVTVVGDDFREGLTAVISVQVKDPQFEGQTKTKLGNSDVAPAVDKVVGEALSEYLEEHPEEAKLIVEKVLLAAQARTAAERARSLVQRKTVLSGGGLPGKLADCSSKDPAKCELFIVEGDSAGGTAKQGRDREFQAILPLRGKILNVEKAQEHRIFENQEIRNIYTALGVTVGTEDDPKALNLSKLRYHKVIIMTDADVDGAHIGTLILTFFFRKMRELIEDGYVYLATPPLYLCKKGKEEEYCWTEQQRRAFVERFADGNENKVHIQRYKGLGEMNEEQLWQTTMNPNTRILKQITMDDILSADTLFSTLMGENVEPRKKFISDNANYARIDA